MRKVSSFTLTAAAALLGLAATPASAISTIGNCDVNDVTSALYGAADACYGLVEGNITPDGGSYFYEDMIPDSAFGGAFAGDNWTVAEINFDVESHTWQGDLSGFEELIIVLKQATLWGAWYFNPADDFGTWSTIWDYPRGNPGGGLSHGFALVRGATNVPEPGMLALFGLGLLGAGFLRRRS
jgi:hypothetical protein